ncbi:hypothetical protein M9Y10_029726 [Tritrichomonas musculus]|uniref:receptor protein-tyrosine kinase n=1 Tax=Tritrichomonas musculus TaxID=1915356 RepID=A0ABR2KN43_9EUKA
MKKFIKNLNFEDLNKNVWREISNALEVNDDDDEDEDKKDISKIKRYSQYQSQGIKFYPDEKKPFNGIINYLIDKSENKIEKEVIITVSSSSPVFPDPNSVVSYKNLLLGGFRSKDEPNSWICGWYGGDSGGNGKSFSSGSSSGGGGSCWTFTESSFNFWKSKDSTNASKFILNNSYHLTDTMCASGDKEFPTPDGNGTECGHSGNGYAKITPI